MDNIKEKLQNEVLEYLGEEADLFDFDAFYDDSLTYGENKNLIFKQIKELFGNKEQINNNILKSEEEQFKAQELKFKAESEQKYKYVSSELKDKLNNLKSVCVVGETGTGKTSFCFYLIELFKKYSNKKIYAYKFPKPELLEKLGIEKLYSIEELINLRDAVVLLTEPQITIPKYDKRNNDNLQKVLSLARQRDITILMDTSDTGYINRRLESYIHCWIIKDLEYSLVKQGSIIKKIIRDNTFIDPREFRLNKNEFLFYSREFYKLNRKWEFLESESFNQQISKCFK